MSHRIIAITGGIGAGKSVVCRVVATMGYPVYDCDSRAKLIMDESEFIKSQLADLFSPKVVEGGNIDRKMLASIVFNDSCALKRLNNLVHSAVIDDFRQWADEDDTSKAVFVETAILYQSGLYELVDEIWEVVAPVDIRIRRAKMRDAASEADIFRRIESQAMEEKIDCALPVFNIINDDIEALLPQIHNLMVNLSASR